MHTIPLPGCSPTPLAAYLKALGILRVLSLQCPESKTQCHWDGLAFVIRTKLSEEELLDFLVNRYSPTPFVSPWNAGSGFYFQEGKTKEKAADGKKIKTGIRDQETEATRSITVIQKSSGKRLSNYREIIEITKHYLEQVGRIEAPKDEQKKDMLRDIRNLYPDHMLCWIDAAFILSGEDLVPPPLLLSGGNEGNLDFSNTFAQNVLSIVDGDNDLPTQKSKDWLVGSLFLLPTQLESGSSSGYFAPNIRGGANSTTGFSSKSQTNPWDFILTMEGIVLFTGNATKKLISNRYEVSFPFSVKSSSGGYMSGENKESLESKGEVWLPTWSQFTDYDELVTVFAEGRASIGKRAARNGVDFAQAVSSLGVDRGLDGFYRYGILPRFGDSYFAAPLQHILVHRDPVITDLLASCDGWISAFLNPAKGEAAPGSIRRAATRLEAAIFSRAAAAQENNPDTAQELLIALGECERALSGISEKWREKIFLNLKPLPPLPRGWIKAADNHTVEYRLAAALASLSVRFKKDFFPLRRHLEPVKVITSEKAWTDWSDEALNEVVWHEGSVIDVLCAMMKRRLLLAKSAGESSWPEYARLTAWPTDIAAFIEGRIDETRFAQLLWGLSLVDFSGDAMTSDEMPTPPSRIYDETPSAFYAQLKLCFASRLPDDKRVPIEQIIFNLAASGDGARASTQALRRLHGSSIPVTSIQIPLAGEAARRSASALLFPLWDTQLSAVGRAVAPDFFPPLNLR